MHTSESERSIVMSEEALSSREHANASRSSRSARMRSLQQAIAAIESGQREAMRPESRSAVHRGRDTVHASLQANAKANAKAGLDVGPSSSASSTLSGRNPPIGLLGGLSGSTFGSISGSLLGTPARQRFDQLALIRMLHAAQEEATNLSLGEPDREHQAILTRGCVDDRHTDRHDHRPGRLDASPVSPAEALGSWPHDAPRSESLERIPIACADHTVQEFMPEQLEPDRLGPDRALPDRPSVNPDDDRASRLPAEPVTPERAPYADRADRAHPADATGDAPIATGAVEIDRLFGGGLPWRGVHEWYGSTSEAPHARAAGTEILPIGAAVAFAHAVMSSGASSLWPGAAVLWIGRRVWPYPRSLIRGVRAAWRAAWWPSSARDVGASVRDEGPPAAAENEVDASLLARSLFVDPREHDEDEVAPPCTIWCIEQAIRSTGIALVIADGTGLSMADTRRLHVAMFRRATPLLLLLLRPASELATLSAALTRWILRPGIAPQCDRSTDAPWRMRWDMRLVRCKAHLLPGILRAAPHGDDPAHADCEAQREGDQPVDFLIPAVFHRPALARAWTEAQWEYGNCGWARQSTGSMTKVIDSS
jgi:hypothetical protein